MFSWRDFLGAERDRGGRTTHGVRTADARDRSSAAAHRRRRQGGRPGSRSIDAPRRDSRALVQVSPVCVVGGSPLAPARPHARRRARRSPAHRSRPHVTVCMCLSRRHVCGPRMRDENENSIQACFPHLEYHCAVAASQASSIGAAPASAPPAASLCCCSDCSSNCMS